MSSTDYVRRRRLSRIEPGALEDSRHVHNELAQTDGLSDGRSLQSSAYAKNSVLRWTADWKAFTSWCQRNDHNSLPAEPLVVATYLAQAAKMLDADGNQRYSISTLRVRLSSIDRAHTLGGFIRPGQHQEVLLVMKGIVRSSSRALTPRAPLLLKDLRRVLEEIDLVGPISGVIGHRDWLMILFGFVGAYRRSELAFLTVGDVTRHSEDGLHVMLRRGKTDQAGVGLLKALPHAGNFITCAPCAFTKWIRLLAVVPAEASSMAALLQTSRKNKHVCHEALPELFLLDPGSPLIRPVMKGGHIADRHISGNVVNDAVKRRMENAGFDSKKFGAHSLRAGFVTQAFRDGATHHEVMRQTGHKTTSSVEHYARELNPLMANAVGKMQL